MSSQVETLSAQVRALSVEDRARLAEVLLDSLQEPSETDTDDAWDEEIERRVRAIEAGTVKLIPSEQVHAEARRIYAR